MPNEEMTFEQAMKRLEEIVRLLDGGNAPLAQTLTLYEEAVSLVNRCNAELENARQRVLQLTQNPDGTVTAQDITEEVTNGK